MDKWRNMVVWYWQDTRCLPQLLYHSRPQLGRGRKKHNERLMGCSQDRKESLNNYRKRQGRLRLGKSVLIYYIRLGSWEKNPAILRHLPLTIPFFPGLILLLIFSTSLWAASRDRECFLCCTFLRRRSPHTLPLMQHGVPPMQESSLWISSVGVFPMVYSFLQTSPEWVPPGDCQETCSVRSISFPSFCGLGICRAVAPTYSHSSLQL